MSITRFTLAAGFLFVASQAAAQSGANSSNRHWNIARAGELIEQAEQIQDLRLLQTKAKLFEQAVTFMPTDDPRRAATLLLAGSASFYSGNPRRARELFQRAAAASEQGNDAIASADIYYTLLALAVQERRRDDARRIVDRMVELADAPGMAEVQRTAIWRGISIQLASLTKSVAQ